MANRETLSTLFLAEAGWANATRTFLAGDASDRRYERLKMGMKTAVLMDAPPGKGDDPADFIAIGSHLNALGLSAPRIFAQDLQNGFLLIEDLGDALFARLINEDPAQEQALYAAATDVLLHLQSSAPPANLPNLSAEDWAQAAGFALEWYRFAITGDVGDVAGFQAVLVAAMRAHADGPRVLILRDYHAENLLWLPERAELAKVGLLDFQLGQLGQPSYDLVSLLQDARREVSPQTEAEMMNRFRGGTDAQSFAAAYATVGAQRALRILGIFARLCLKGGKAQYVTLIPRVWRQLQRNLMHSELAELAAFCALWLPEPTPDALERIRTQCGTQPTR
ncbi:aminoglycoside phosphotransferase [Pseudorhodobacter turbinis]|uniref:Aminoglycoside phosphotransferase n=1 Tax=Pseudorhodobacter turbinis TaxID=2500533 RepID=A0A4P8EH63_9RHOB|nr:phosphotransferase [Pseudorhodobacter turbinis]QCO55865.1 aminoglycoside phosphotransferase [Pseudorhodobacter turbinis]